MESPLIRRKNGTKLALDQRQSGNPFNDPTAEAGKPGQPRAKDLADTPRALSLTSHGVDKRMA